MKRSCVTIGRYGLLSLNLSYYQYQICVREL
jgi:hypothetical protein